MICYKWEPPVRKYNDKTDAVNNGNKNTMISGINTYIKHEEPIFKNYKNLLWHIKENLNM